MLYSLTLHALFSNPSMPVCSKPDHADFSRAHMQLVLQGLWTACYGSHGHEILHVWFDESLQTHNGAPVSQTSSPERRPRPRLVGCKVTGDANVPANEWSFVAQVCAAMAKTHTRTWNPCAYRAEALRSFASEANAASGQNSRTASLWVTQQQQEWASSCLPPASLIFNTKPLHFRICSPLSIYRFCQCYVLPT